MSVRRLEPESPIGLSNLPTQMLRKVAEKGFEFTLMVVGESSVGKSTLLKSLFMMELEPERILPGIIERPKKTLEIEITTLNMEERGVKLRMNIIDTPGFGDKIDNSQDVDSIVKYIDKQYERTLRHETSLYRRPTVDTKVHCCFYFISPYGYCPTRLDIEFLKKLHSKVNVVPVIAKADCFNKREMKRMKTNVLNDLKEHNIKVYMPTYEADDDDNFKEQVNDLIASMPLAVCGASEVKTLHNQRKRIRRYPWGEVDIDNPDHCDFTKLRTLMIEHMTDLQVQTQVFYEAYRVNRLTAIQKQLSTASESTWSTSAQIAVNSALNDKFRKSEEKAEDLQRKK